MVSREQRDNILFLKLDRGVTNPINGELVAVLSTGLSAAIESADVGAIVLSSSNEKFFSIGLDIPGLFLLGRDEFAEFLREFNRLTVQMITLSKPIVAAIGGHAVAGGCILALGCDYRLIAAGKKLMGLNEAKLGVPVPYPALCVLHALVGLRAAREIVDSALFYGPEDSLRMGLVDKVVPSGEIERASEDHARGLAEIPAAVYAQIKRDRLGPMLDDIRARSDEKERDFLDHWFSPRTRETLKQAAEKFRG